MDTGIMMPLLASQQRDAEMLYRQRITLLGRPTLPLTLLHRHDTRLAANLYALSLAEQADNNQSTPLAELTAKAAFVHVWVGLTRQPEAALLQLAVELEKLDHDHLEAVGHALHWRPEAYLDQLTAIAQAHEAFTAWPAALQAALLPMPGTVSAELALPEENTPAPLCARLLQQLDQHPDSHLDVFRPWYAHTDDKVRHSALIAGLHRRDSQALDAVENDLPTANTPEQPPLGLIACLLASRQRPALTQAHPLLAGLSGDATAVPALLDWLSHPSSAEIAAEGWFWLTGQTLPRRPRLQEVGGDAPASGPTLPDAEAAQRWWDQHGWAGGDTPPPGGPGSADSTQGAGLAALFRAALAGLSQGRAHAALYRPDTLWLPPAPEVR